MRTCIYNSTDFHEFLKRFAEFRLLYQRYKRIHGGPTEGAAKLDGTVDFEGFVFGVCMIRV